MNLLQMSRSGAVMILAIVVIRALAINKLPKKAFLGLWGVATVRLLIPYSLPSAFSIYSLLGRFAPATEKVKDVPALAPMIPTHNVTLVPGASAVHTASAPIDPWTVVWLVGGLVCAVFFIVAYLKCRREFKASLPVDNEYAKRWLSEHHIYRTIEIRQSGRISAPLTYGVFRPVILMPKTADWDDLDTLNYVLTHEYVHIRRFDAVTKLALTAALCVHWFNPAVWIMYVLANRDIELSCDEAVIRQFGERTKSAYAMTLIRMEETRSGLTPLCNNFSKNAIEERITAIMKIKKTSLFTLFAAAILVVSVTVAFATSGRNMDRISEEEAFDLLEKSITYEQGALSFTVPDADTPSDPWYINVAGRLEYPDGFSSSIHYFTTTEWVRGKTYSEWIGESSLYFTDLFLDMELGECQRSIDLIPYVQGVPALPGMRETVMQETTIMSYVDLRDGMSYYSFDGGKTFEPLTPEAFKARFPSPKVEWWTYDEYKVWLENEKVILQDMIGEKAWTSGRGDFVWTQEIVDEAIAMYEEILENIGRGMLYSKTIDGEADTSLMMGMNPADIWMDTHEAVVASADFTQYKPFGLEWNNGEKALYFNGQRVRYFLDGVDLDGTGAMAIWLEYADAELKGEIDVHTVRERVQNADGSYDPMGPLTGLEKYSQAEFDARSFLPSSLEAVTYASEDIAWQTKETRELLDTYAPFGLSYEIDSATGEISMNWQGKPVHSIFDAVRSVWIANSLRGLYLGPDAVDLEAVYERGRLTGLRETQDQPITQTAYAMDGDSAAEPGTSFAECFEKYAPFGIAYEETEGASGVGNVYYNGQLVSRFVDLTPDGGAFTFTSAEQGGITVKTVYDNSGRLTGVSLE